MVIGIRDHILIAGINFNKETNIIELISFSKIDVYKKEQLFETLEIEEGESTSLAMTLEPNERYTISFEGIKIMNLEIFRNFCKITTNKMEKFNVYDNLCIFFKSFDSILFVYEK